MEPLIEVANHGVPLALAFLNLVEFLLHVGGEVVVDDVFKILQQELVDQDADIGGDEFALFCTVCLFTRFIS